MKNSRLAIVSAIVLGACQFTAAAAEKKYGPGVTGTAIQGGVNHELKEGDVIVIPAGTPHWFSKINGSIVYLVIRIDPSQLITLQ